jgi:hypothetical protein
MDSPQLNWQCRFIRSAARAHRRALRFPALLAGFILAVMLVCSHSLHAQTITGSILGTVTDPSGAVVSGAKVNATNTSTGVVTTTTTNSDGLYNIRFLPVGP